MDKGSIQVGRQYAVREKVSAGEPLVHVQVLEHLRGGQVKVRRLSEPSAGGEELLQTRQFLAPWGERRALLRDEECAQRFARGARHSKPGARRGHSHGDMRDRLQRRLGRG